MAQKAPGKHYPMGISLVEIARMFPDDAAAEDWIVKTRWPDGVRCPHCDAAKNPGSQDAQAAAVPLPSLPEALQRADQHPDAELEAQLAGLGDGVLSSGHRHEGHVEPEAASQSGRDAEDRLALGAPRPRDLAERAPGSHQAGRGRRIPNRRAGAD